MSDYCTFIPRLQSLLPKIRAIVPQAQVLVINDGSTDNTQEICNTCAGVEILNRVYGVGNGAAIKAGARVATGDILVFMDGDGQHNPEDIPRLLEMLDHGYDMVIGARDQGSQANIARSLANGLYNRLASWMVERHIPDLTSGFRTVYANKFREFLYLLPNGFSYPTTITMAFFRAGYQVGYIPIHAAQRTGKSHIRPLHDGLNFLLIIFRIGTLYSPLKLFFPISMLFAILGLGHYLYKYIYFHKFTNMSALLISMAVLIFMIGLVSEQITSLIYLRNKD
ncbi:glycosyl transferase [Achromatium sp. WMS2]|nr:glycosyl transferase [Achromatium sp. WMS2]